MRSWIRWTWMVFLGVGLTWACLAQEGERRQPPPGPGGPPGVEREGVPPVRGPLGPGPGPLEGRRRLGPGPQGMQAPPGPRGPGEGMGQQERLRLRDPAMAAGLLEPLSPEEEERALDLIRKERPWEMERLERAKANNPRAYTMMLRRVLLGERMLDRLQEEDPEAAELRKRELEFERHEHELAEAYRKAGNEAEKQDLEKKLREVLGRHFDLRSQNHQREIQRVEEELERLRQRMAEREANKDEIIKNMSLQLLGKGDVMAF